MSQENAVPTWFPIIFACLMIFAFAISIGFVSGNYLGKFEELYLICNQICQSDEIKIDLEAEEIENACTCIDKQEIAIQFHFQTLNLKI